MAGQAHSCQGNWSDLLVLCSDSKHAQERMFLFSMYNIWPVNDILLIHHVSHEKLAGIDYLPSDFSRLQYDPLYATAETRRVSIMLLHSRSARTEPRFLPTWQELHLGGRGQPDRETQEGVEHDLHHRRGVQPHRYVSAFQQNHLVAINVSRKLKL